MDWERREFARTAPAAAPRRSPDGETLPALSVLHLPEGERQRRWIHEEFFSRFFPPSPAPTQRFPAPADPGAARSPAGSGREEGDARRIWEKGGSGGAFPAVLHLRSARRLRSCEYSREILGKEGGREGIPRWRSLGYFLGGDLGPRVLPGFSASNKARSLRFPSKNWVRKDDFFLTFCEEGWGFPLLFFFPQ